MPRKGSRTIPTAPFWVRGAATILDGWITLDSAHVETYNPITTPNPRDRVLEGGRHPLVFALAAARTKPQVLQFANDYPRGRQGRSRSTGDRASDCPAA